MLCYLESVRIIERDGRTPMLSCTWIGKSGDSEAAKTEKKGKRRVLNRKAALARTTTLTKGVFPSDMDDLYNWMCDLTPLRWFDTERNELTSHDEVLKCVEDLGLDMEDDEKEDCGTFAESLSDENLTYAGLTYEQIPVSDLDEKHDYCYYENVAGNEVKLLTITAIGYTELDDDGNEIIKDGKPVWDLDGQESAFDMAARSYRNGVDSGTYYFESLNEDEDEDENEDEKPKKEKPKEKLKEKPKESKPSRRRR